MEGGGDSSPVPENMERKMKRRKAEEYRGAV